MTSTFRAVGDQISNEADLEKFFAARNIEGNSKARLVLKKDGTLMSVKKLSLGAKIMSFFRKDTFTLRGLADKAENSKDLSFLKTNANFALLVEKRNCGSSRKIKLDTVKMYSSNEAFRAKFQELITNLNVEDKQKLAGFLKECDENLKPK